MRKKYPAVPLEQLSIPQLELELLSRAQRYGRDGREMIASAGQLATYLHRNQSRATSLRASRVPYIGHPLRVAVRTLRWGEVTPETVTSALLHDTVEDCAERITHELAARAKISEQLRERLNDPELRKLAMHEISLDYLHTAYGQEVAANVDQLSNHPTGATTYLDGLRELAGSGGYGAKLVKASDLIDNAGSLARESHNLPGTLVVKLLARYSPAVPLIAGELERISKHEGPLSISHPFNEAAEELRAVERGMAKLQSELDRKKHETEEKENEHLRI